jgi:hypothetical protein
VGPGGQWVEASAGVTVRFGCDAGPGLDSGLGQIGFPGLFSFSLFLFLFFFFF